MMRTTAPGQSALLLLDVVELLQKRRIPYAVVGAFAASFYGMVRASLDADAVISLRTPQERDDLCRDLKEQGLKVERRVGDAEDPIAAVIHVGDRFHNRVDLLIGIRGMTDGVFLRLEQTQFMGCSLNMIGLEDFIAMKMFAGSPKDIRDVIGVLEVSKDKIKAGLLEDLSALYGNECTTRLQALLKEYPLKE